MMFNLCVGSGYGRCKIANLISSQGIQTRTGGNWHEATVGHILHNITYMGILRSGDTQSEVFPELQIIDSDTFELAQKLMAERVNEYNDQRTMPFDYQRHNPKKCGRNDSISQADSLCLL